MFKKYRVLKWTLVTIFSLIAGLFLFGIWFASLIPPKDDLLESTSASDLSYLSEQKVPYRGKILAVVTSTDVMGSSGKRTGYELTELARAYYVFEANGFEVDIASPLGGTPPVVIDDDDMGPFDFAFLNDPQAQAKTANTIPINDVVPEDYQAVFFAGGKGAMFDFPDNKAIQTIVRTYTESNKVVGAVCHGPAALVNVRLKGGQLLLKNRTVSGFTNSEELLLISDAESIFPFLLQSKMIEQGAQFNEGAMYLEKMSQDNNLITGQNPWSTWILAETMIKQLGYTPKYREITDEENAIKILSIYETDGLRAAKDLLEEMSVKEMKPINRVLFAQHGVVGVMKGEMWRFIDMMNLTSFAKKHEPE
ncbi:MAG: type 1 glutamine amidotransferase domain-containing protein [Bacteroidota bacterium]